MNELALFAGAGGGILGGHLLGWRTVCAVEWEAYPASVLCARQNDGLLPSFPIWDDVQTFDGKPWRGIVDVVSGGFPCQDISAAGKGAGIDGERSGMWKEMARIISEVRPKYAFVENSPMLTSRGLGTVLSDLSKMGFNAEWGVVGAADVGANHKRERIWICAKQRNIFSYTEYDRNGWRKQQSESVEKTIGTMANTRCKLRKKRNATELDSETQIRSSSPILNQSSGKGQGNMANSKVVFSNGSNNNSRICMEQKTQSKPRNNSGKENVSNSSSIRQQGQRKYEQSINSTQDCKRQANYVESIGSSDFWAVEPNMGRVADGVAGRMDRLKAIGNGQVPLCAATAWNLLRKRIDG